VHTIAASAQTLAPTPHLQDDDVLQPHDLHCCKVLAGLRLRAGLVGGDQQHGSIHDGGAVEHRSHEDVVAGAVHKADVAHKLHLGILKPWGARYDKEGALAV
jgi:hypothetical protein